MHPIAMAVAAALGMGADAALAQGVAAPRDVLVLEEIVVTAQRREENLQDVPVSAVVIDESSRVLQHLESLSDLTQTVPSVHVGQNGRSNDMYIRGIGSGINPSFDQSVGMFIDDIYHGRSRSTVATFLDLDRVEILKGPQSTFFGNNAIAGAFSIVTRKPTSELEGSVRTLYGEDGQYAVEGALGGPVATDLLSARAAVVFNGTDGWLKNVSTGEHVPKEHNKAARLTLLFTPGRDWDITLKGEGSQNSSSGAFPDQIVNCPPPAPFATAGFCKAALGLGVPVGLGNDLTASSAGQSVTLNTVESVLTVNYHQWGQTFTSVSGYYNYHYDLNLDPDSTPLNLFHAQVPEHYHQFSQELRVASPTGRTLEYLAGAYYQTDELVNHQDSSYFFLSPTIAANARLAPLVPYLPLGQDINFLQNEHSYSVFGSLTWNLTEHLKLSPSVRGSWVDKDFNGNLFYGTATQTYGGISPLPAAVVPLASALGLGVPHSQNLTRTDRAWMPSAKLQYSWNPATMFYVSYARGFKAGGFNGSDTTGVAANAPFAPEHVNAYEAGFKSKWLSERLLLNLDVFRSDYHDLQVAALQQLAAGTFVSVVNNAANSRSQGVELQGEWIASRSFRVAAEATYLDAYYERYPNASPTALQQLNGSKVQDLSGKPTEFSPHTSGSVTVAYTPTLFGGYQLTTELIGHFSSGYFLSGVDDDLVRQPAYARLDARLALGTPDGNWNIDVIGRNLTDRNILVFATPMATSLGSVLEEKEQPRNIAVQIRYHW